MGTSVFEAVTLRQALVIAGVLEFAVLCCLVMQCLKRWQLKLSILLYSQHCC